MTNPVDKAALITQRTEAVQQYVMHHLRDARVFPLFGLHIPLPAGLTVHGVMTLLTALLLLLLFGVLYRKRDPVPRGLTNLLELFVLFIRDQIAVPFLGAEDGRRMTPLLCSLFFFILGMNLLGLVPCFAAATANASVTGALAAGVLAYMVLGGIMRHGLIGFFKGFIPSGVPWPVLILLVPIEIVGLLIKSFALCIRLFANMFAGHAVVFFLLGMVIILGVAGLPFAVLAVAVFVVEIGVAFLQAYIFTLLSAVFVGQRLHPEH
jgi:F-type H+-transporting ATPase subunit a